MSGDTSSLLTAHCSSAFIAGMTLLQRSPGYTGLDQICLAPAQEAADSWWNKEPIAFALYWRNSIIAGSSVSSSSETPETASFGYWKSIRVPGPMSNLPRVAVSMYAKWRTATRRDYRFHRHCRAIRSAPVASIFIGTSMRCVKAVKVQATQWLRCCGNGYAVTSIASVSMTPSLVWRRPNG